MIWRFYDIIVVRVLFIVGSMAMAGGDAFSGLLLELIISSEIVLSSYELSDMKPQLIRE